MDIAPAGKDEWSELFVPRNRAVDDPGALNIVSALQASAARSPDRICVIVDGEAVTYAALCSRVGRLAAALSADGVVAGDRIAVMSRNAMEFVELVFAVAWIGAVLVPFNVAWRGPQLAHILNDCEPKLVFLQDEFFEQLSAVSAPACSAVHAVRGDPPSTRIWGRSIRPFPTAETEIPSVPVAPGQLGSIMYTSGTTGVSKGVMCPMAQMYWWGERLSETIRIGDTSVVYSSLPLFHINAMAVMVAATARGATYVLDSRFTASRYWERVATFDVTHVCLLGALAGMLVAQPERDTDRSHRVRTVFAADMPPQLWQPFRRRYNVEEIIASYGGTETNQVIGATDGRRSEPGFMGRIVPGFQARVVDENECEVPDGSPGQLVVRTDLPHAFCLGYLNRPAETLAVMSNCWWHTGDRVVRDTEGRFTFVDRFKDMIRRRGENISTWEVESALLSHPAVLQAAVYGVPSDLGDEEVAAAIVTAPGNSIDALQLTEHVAERVAHFAVPRYLRFVGELPLTENGKITKAPLRSAGITRDTWDRGDVRRPRQAAPAKASS